MRLSVPWHKDLVPGHVPTNPGQPHHIVVMGRVGNSGKRVRQLSLDIHGEPLPNRNNMAQAVSPFRYAPRNDVGQPSGMRPVCHRELGYATSVQLNDRSTSI